MPRAASIRVDVKPALLRWARERARLREETLLRQFPKLREWEAGTTKPTLRQVEAFADATASPLGYLFLPEPPEDALPIPDFRTLDDQPIRRPSANLLDTIFDMQRRQAWLREDRIEAGHEPLPFIGSVTADAAPARIAAAMRRTVGAVAGWADLHGTWTDALSWLRNRAEMIGIIVVINGVVGNNTRRKLDPEEFRGFVLPDDYAPFVFLNGSDGKAARCSPWLTSWRICGSIKLASSICEICSPRPIHARGFAMPLRPSFSSQKKSCGAFGVISPAHPDDSLFSHDASKSANWSPHGVLWMLG